MNDLNTTQKILTDIPLLPIPLSANETPRLIKAEKVGRTYHFYCHAKNIPINERYTSNGIQAILQLSPLRAKLDYLSTLGLEFIQHDETIDGDHIRTIKITKNKNSTNTGTVITDVNNRLEPLAKIEFTMLNQITPILIFLRTILIELLLTIATSAIYYVTFIGATIFAWEQTSNINILLLISLLYTLIIHRRSKVRAHTAINKANVNKGLEKIKRKNFTLFEAPQTYQPTSNSNATATSHKNELPLPTENYNTKEKQSQRTRTQIFSLAALSKKISDIIAPRGRHEKLNTLNTAIKSEKIASRKNMLLTYRRAYEKLDHHWAAVKHAIVFEIQRIKKLNLHTRHNIHAKLVLIFVITPALLFALDLSVTSTKFSNQKLREVLFQNSLAFTYSRGEYNLERCNCERTLLPEEVNKNIETVLTQIEDRRFHQHIGIDLIGLASAVYSLGQRGGSTIHMQLSKNLITGRDRTLLRKYRDIKIAILLNLHFSKDDILRYYLSSTGFGRIGGREVVGLRRAADIYFGKAAQNLNYSESLLLISVLNAPYKHSPVHNPENLISKMIGLSQDLANRKIFPKLTEDEIRTTVRRAAAPNDLYMNKDRYLEDHIKTKLPAFIGDYDRSEVRVSLTVDPIAQYYSRTRLKSSIAQNSSNGVQRGALVALHPSGEIIAVEGGADFNENQYNYAMEGTRPIASTAKLLTYASAIEQGYQAETLVMDTKQEISHKALNNYNKDQLGEISLEQCFYQSRNICTYWIAEHLTSFEKVLKLADRLDLLDEQRQNVSDGKDIVLGTFETTPLKIASAFATVANNGTYCEPKLIERIYGKNGKILFDGKSTSQRCHRVFSTEANDQIIQLLEKVVMHRNGTGRNAKLVTGSTFGKTGTSDDYRDAWFVGFTDARVTTAIWAGPSVPSDTMSSAINGGSLPARIFKSFNTPLNARLMGIMEDAKDYNPRIHRDYIIER